MEENNEAVMNQLRERLSAADNTANTPLPPSTEDVSSKLLFLTEMKAFITISFLSERTLQQPLWQHHRREQHQWPQNGYHRGEYKYRNSSYSSTGKYIFLHYPWLQGDEEDGLEDMEAYGQGCHGSANDNGCCLESSALSSPPRCLPGSDIAVAQGIQILPHLPKYSICIKKGPSGFLGKLLLSPFPIHTK